MLKLLGLVVNVYWLSGEQVLFLYSTTIETANLLQKLSLDSQKKLEITEPKKKPSMDSKDVGNSQTQSMDRSVTPLLPYFMDPTVCYVPNGYTSTTYYYGYDGSGSEWEDYLRYVNPDGVEMPGAYGDNGSLMYHPGYSYAAYNPYSSATSPVPTVGMMANYMEHNITIIHIFIFFLQLVLHKLLRLLHQNVRSPPLQLLTKHYYLWILLMEILMVLQMVGVASGYQDPRFGFDGVRSPIPWLDGSMFTDGQARPVAGNSITPSFSNGDVVPSLKNQNVHPNIMYGNTFSSGMGFGSNRYDSCNMGRGWMTIDNRFKPRGRGNSFYGYGNENMDRLNELNRDQESYSEDDVHKSIKYNVWASTPNGNKKLDVAYQKAQQKSRGCPVFLFFSVSFLSEQFPEFVGVAEMAGSVDFNKNVEYWKQDKWIGCFHVKWHIVKDLPNNLLINVSKTLHPILSVNDR
ncbi:hypothetical protein KY290_004448 [Solanum tuberosum]|uniref:YTH domain-containing family protein n=1 Tax=Solanum tuberosum TaxID=4113 RepID=A0ABQ7WW97_SOLTU|nr:hypothetical protein KY290_004448 [Solanum tuberosum]